jgi:hypothetical protein
MYLITESNKDFPEAYVKNYQLGMNIAIKKK